MSVSFEKISNISQIQFLRNDWIFFDIDRTTLITGLDKYTDPVHPIRQTVQKIIELIAEGFIVFFLTARSSIYSEQTLEQLSSLGIKTNPFPNSKFDQIKFKYTDHIYAQGVLFASSIRGILQKASVLQIFMREVLSLEGVNRPRRVLMLDDAVDELTGIKNKASKIFRNALPNSLPCVKLFQFAPKECLSRGFPNENPIFPDDLITLTYISHLYGGTGGVHLFEDLNGMKFVLKAGNSQIRMKDEICNDSIYRLMGTRSEHIRVPDFAIYNCLPKDMAQELQLPPSGTYRLSLYIEPHSNWSEFLHYIVDENELTKKNIIDIIKDIDFQRYPHFKELLSLISQEMSHSCVLDAFLGNNDIAGHIFNIIVDKDKKVWHIDNGSTNRFWGKGELKDETQSTENQLRKFLEHEHSISSLFYGQLTKSQSKEQAQTILNMAHEILKTIENLHSIIHFEKYSQLLERFYDGFADLQYIFAIDIPEFQSKFSPARAKFTAAGTMLFSFHNEEAYIPLARRKKTGLWGDQGGFSELEPFLAHSAAREMGEETLFKVYLRFTDLLFHTPYDDLVTIEANGMRRYRMYFSPALPFFSFDHINGQLAKGNEEHTEISWVRAVDIKRALENPEYILIDNERILKVEGHTDEGKERELLLYPPMVKLLLQPRAKSILDAIVKKEKFPKKPILKVKKERYSLDSPFSQRCQIARTVLLHFQMIKSIQTPRAKITSETSSDQIQSNIHLQVLLGDKYQSNNPDANVRAIIDSDPELQSLDPSFFQLIPGILSAEKRNGKWVFYHAAEDTVASLYDFYTEIRKQLYGIFAEDYKVFRLLDHHFNFADLNQFISHFLSFDDEDDVNYRGNYQEVGLSANFFLLGRLDSSTSSSLRLFLNNKSRNPPDLWNILQYLGSILGVSDATICELFKIVPPKGGRLFQIFIDDSVVDEIVYPAGHGGVLNELEIDGKKIRSIREIFSILKKNPQAHAEYIRKLQARIYLKPEIFHDVNLVQVKEYCSTQNEEVARYKSRVKYWVEQMVLELLASDRALIPNSFMTRSSVLTHMDLHCAKAGLEKLKFTSGLQLAHLIRTNNGAGLAEFIKSNLTIDLDNVPNPNYMAAGAPKSVKAESLIDNITINWECYTLITLLRMKVGLHRHDLILQDLRTIMGLLDKNSITVFQKIIDSLVSVQDIDRKKVLDMTLRFVVCLGKNEISYFTFDTIYNSVAKNHKDISEEHYIAAVNKETYITEILSLPKARVIEIAEALECLGEVSLNYDPYISLPHQSIRTSEDLLLLPSGKIRSYMIACLGIFTKYQFSFNDIVFARLLALAERNKLSWYVEQFLPFLPSELKNAFIQFAQEIQSIPSYKIFTDKTPLSNQLEWGTNTDWISIWSLFLQLTSLDNSEQVQKVFSAAEEIASSIQIQKELRHCLIIKLAVALIQVPSEHLVQFTSAANNLLRHCKKKYDEVPPVFQVRTIQNIMTCIDLLAKIPTEKVSYAAEICSWLLVDLPWFNHIQQFDKELIELFIDLSKHSIEDLKNIVEDAKHCEVYSDGLNIWKELRIITYYHERKPIEYHF